MKIVVTGATGFIGRALCSELAGGHEVVGLTRRPEKVCFDRDASIDVVRWNAEQMDGWETSLEGADAVVNLAGTNPAAGRWTESFKASILSSRIRSSRILLEAIRETAARPKSFVISSAIGFYGSRGDEQLDEGSGGGEGFLVDVCRENESAAKEVEALGMRAIVLRTGVVLDLSGGALPKMAMPFRFCLGGRWGGGEQWMSWISLADEVSAVRFLIENDGLKGVFILTSPEPVRNRSFCQTLAGVLKRPCWLPMPAILLRMMFGQMADEMFLASQRVCPSRLLAAGYEFKHAGLRDALLATDQDQG